MPPTPPPAALFASMAHLADNGAIRCIPRDFAHSPEDGWTFGMVRAVRGRDVHDHFWEMHPDSDELVAVVTGSLRVHLREQDGCQPEAIPLGPGTVVTIPSGRWHRLEVVEPSDVLALTRATGTRLEPVDPHATA